MYKGNLEICNYKCLYNEALQTERKKKATNRTSKHAPPKIYTTETGIYNKRNKKVIY